MDVTCAGHHVLLFTWSSEVILTLARQFKDMLQSKSSSSFCTSSRGFTSLASYKETLGLVYINGVWGNKASDFNDCISFHQSVLSRFWDHLEVCFLFQVLSKHPTFSISYSLTPWSMAFSWLFLIHLVIFFRTFLSFRIFVAFTFFSTQLGKPLTSDLRSISSSSDTCLH